MAIIDDEETRQLILKKTWCHGQAILPIYSIILIFWWYHLETRPIILLAGAFILTYWSWTSYHELFHVINGTHHQNNSTRHDSILTQQSARHRKLCTLGFFAMFSHLATFAIAIPRCKENTMNMLMSIVSGLLFIETGAFLAVFTALREDISAPSRVEQYADGQISHRENFFS
mmetsp:Transcript_16046/g.30750  ORF Transcript_16046/g.30750 Transcript_16046/m.30750 type:complete len:173 (-) Transcript_16046:188-706(-)